MVENSVTKMTKTNSSFSAKDAVTHGKFTVKNAYLSALRTKDLAICHENKKNALSFIE